MDIDNRKLNVQKAFSDYFYKVPDYQREYVWEEKNVNELLVDINEEYANNNQSEYFIGSIIVCKSKKEGAEIEVIDGQQRLTTLFLALCSFKELLKQDSAHVTTIQQLLFSSVADNEGNIFSSYKLLLQYDTTENLIKKLVDGDKKIDYQILSDSSKRIIDAYSYITNYLTNNFKDKTELKRFYGYFNNKVNFIQVETPEISDALKIFETINARGVGLNPMDLLKNLIFRNIEKKDFDKLKVEWKQINDLLEKNNEKPLRFLRYFIMANYNAKNAKGEDIVREDEIYQWILANKNQTNHESKPFEFVQLIHENAKDYVYFAKPHNRERDENDSLENIKLLSGSFSQHLILLLSGRGLKKDLFNHLAKQTETLIFYYILTRTSTKDLERDFSRWARIIKPISNLDDIEQKCELNKFIRDYLLPEIKLKEKEYENDFLNFSYTSLQQYRLRYILAKISKHVQHESYKTEHGLSYYIKCDIEHILPNTPDNDLLSAFEGGNKELYDQYKAKLGNLTLLEIPINRTIGRDFFKIKKNDYKKSTIYLTKSIACKEDVGNSTISKINRDLIQFDNDDWDKNSIDKRQKMLYDLSKKIWVIEELK